MDIIFRLSFLAFSCRMIPTYPAQKYGRTGWDCTYATTILPTIDITFNTTNRLLSHLIALGRVEGGRLVPYVTPCARIHARHLVVLFSIFLLWFSRLVMGISAVLYQTATAWRLMRKGRGEVELFMCAVGRCIVRAKDGKVAMGRAAVWPV
jgi:hypothetical protein